MIPKPLVAILIAVLTLSITPSARASESCTCQSTGLLQAFNNTDTTQAVYGYNGIANGIGVEGDANTSTGYGVYATSGGTGLYAAGGTTAVRAAISGAHNAVYATNGDTNGTAATISAVSGSDSGTAYWGTGNVQITGAYYVRSTCVAGCSGSDARLKKEIAPLHGALDTLLALKGVTFTWRDPSAHQGHTGPQIGVIAQDVEKVFPQWVSEDDKGFKAVDPDARTSLALTVESLRELDTRARKAEVDNADLRARVRVLEEHQRPKVSGFDLVGLACDLNFGFGLLLVAAGAVLCLWRAIQNAKVIR